ncbi:MAG: hypothetical protein ACRCZI_14875 [Cetobacterium sp.]
MRAGNARADAVFRPTDKQALYASAFADAIAAGRPTTDVTLAAEIKAGRASIQRWRANDAFIEWLEQQTARVFRKGRTHVLARAYALALRGSIKHMELFLRYSGETPADALPTPMGGSNVQANFLICVPRPAGAVPEHSVLVGSGSAA